MRINLQCQQIGAKIAVIDLASNHIFLEFKVILLLKSIVDIVYGNKVPDGRLFI